MKLLIEGNEFIGDPPAPAKTWGEYFENVVTTSRLSGLRVSALAEDAPETNFGNMAQVVDSKEADHIREATEMVEPVAWRYKGEPWFDGNRWHDKFEVTTDERVAKFKDKHATPLYTAPPKREPLTDEEIYAAIKGVDSLRAVDVARAIERAHGIGGDK